MSPPEDWKPGDPVRPGRSHQIAETVPFAEATRRAMEFARATAALPGNVEYRQLRLFGREQRQREKEAAKPGGLIGPPNPYKPHRKG